MPVRIEGLPTVREEDGLAMSSRNAYLSAADRERAGAISRALAAAERRAQEESLEAGLAAARAELEAAGIEAEYLEARDPDDLAQVSVLNGGPVLVAIAARVGDARLIDNVLIQPTTTTTRLEKRDEQEEEPMQRQMLKSKIHRATVTDCDVDYIGSITIDTELMASADLITNEQVHVWDIDNGARFVTYVIDGEPGRGRCR